MEWIFPRYEQLFLSLSPFQSLRDERKILRTRIISEKFRFFPKNLESLQMAAWDLLLAQEICSSKRSHEGNFSNLLQILKINQKLFITKDLGKSPQIKSRKEKFLTVMIFFNLLKTLINFFKQWILFLKI